MRQLVFDLPVTTRFGAEDFLVSDCNEAAFAAVNAWPHWAASSLVLVGPEGSGKSHLGAIWAARSGATVVTADTLAGTDLPALGNGPAVLVEDAHRLGAAEDRLFHLVNLLRERESALLMTAAQPPDRWRLATPDLLSRLRLAPMVEIGAPDDALVRSVLVKLFADRQLTIEAGVVGYIAVRIERSLGAARKVVAELDREALTRGRRITRAMAGEVLRAAAVHDD